MKRDDSGKVVLVTGAARRIGAEIARGLHAAGYRVVVHCRRSIAEAECLCLELNSARPDSARALPADLAAAGKPGEVANRAAGFWGRLDGLVNNASVFYPTPFAAVTGDQWEELLASNLRTPFFLAQAAAESLRGRSGGIVNIVDIYAERPLRGYPVYSLAKAGLAAMTRALAVELAPEIRVNGVAPGTMLWPEEGSDAGEQAAILSRIPLGRMGTPADVAQAVLFLMEAPYVTGQILSVDGGRSLFI